MKKWKTQGNHEQTSPNHRQNMNQHAKPIDKTMNQQAETIDKTMNTQAQTIDRNIFIVLSMVLACLFKQAPRWLNKHPVGYTSFPIGGQAPGS